MLLLWEMCTGFKCFFILIVVVLKVNILIINVISKFYRFTGSIPWNGCDQSNEERQNSLRRRDISLNLQNIPSISPTLRNLLEIGLQSDEAKRTLDMDKISRKLHRLLVDSYDIISFFFFFNIFLC